MGKGGYMETVEFVSGEKGERFTYSSRWSLFKGWFSAVCMLRSQRRQPEREAPQELSLVGLLWPSWWVARASGMIICS